MKIFILMTFFGAVWSVPAPDKDYSDYALPQENFPADQPDYLLPQEQLPADEPDYSLPQENPQSDAGTDYPSEDPAVEDLETEEPDESVDDGDNFDVDEEVLDQDQEEEVSDSSEQSETTDDGEDIEDNGENVEGLEVTDFFDGPVQQPYQSDSFGQDELQVIPAVPSEEEETLDTNYEPLPGYEVPTCVPAFINETLIEEREECFNELVEVCIDVDEEVCQDQCVDVDVEVSAVVEVQECTTVEENECTDIPTEVCEDVNVPVSSIVPEEICEEVTRPDCANKTVDKCTDTTEELCKDETIVVNEPTIQQVCSNKPEEKCKDQLETISVPGYKLDCRKVEKKVCREVEKKVCNEVPQKSCREVQEMKEVTSQHCISKRSLGKKCKKGGCQKLRKYLSVYAKPTPVYHAVPKCWPVTKWVPVWKAVCSDVWAEQCQIVWEPLCDSVWDTVCNKIPVGIEKNVTRNVCTIVDNEECSDVEVFNPVEKVDVVCKNVTAQSCEQEVEEVCSGDKSETECRIIDREVVINENRPKCETKIVPECRAVQRPLCTTVPKEVKETKVQEECKNVCLPRVELRCEQKPERKCKLIPVEVVVSKPVNNCADNKVPVRRVENVGEVRSVNVIP